MYRPDPANQNLTGPCDDFAIKHGIPIFLEKETYRFAKSEKRLALGEPVGGTGTRGALLQAWKRCERLGLTRIALGTGGAYHCLRAKAAAKKIGFEVVEQITVSDVYSWPSKHPQTWTWWLNKGYEFIMRIYYRLRGWM